MDYEKSVCPYPECGQEFTDSRRYDYHLSTCVKNPNKNQTVFKVNRESPAKDKVPASTSETVKPATSAPKKVTNIPTPSNSSDAIRARRSEEWGRYIVNDLNPLMFSAVKSYTGIPDGWEDGVIVEALGPKGEPIKFWDPSLRTRLTFSESEAKRLADAASRFSVSPMGMAIHAWIESNAGLIALALAGFVSAKYGWRVMQTKQEITQLKEVMTKQQEMMQAQAAAAMGADNTNVGASTAA